MNSTSHTWRTLTFVFLLAFSFSLVGPISLVPSVEAASASASKRIIKKLKKQIKTLKAQLAAARAVPPQSVLRLAEALKQAKRRVLSLHRENGGHSTSHEDTMMAMEFMLREAGR